jgi:hypothetical protein
MCFRKAEFQTMTMRERSRSAGHKNRGYNAPTTPKYVYRSGFY